MRHPGNRTAHGLLDQPQAVLGVSAGETKPGQIATPGRCGPLGPLRPPISSLRHGSQDPRPATRATTTSMPSPSTNWNAVVPGDLETCGGLHVHEHSRVLHEDGSAIAGIWQQATWPPTPWGRTTRCRVRGSDRPWCSAHRRQPPIRSGTPRTTDAAGPLPDNRTKDRPPSWSRHGSGSWEWGSQRPEGGLSSRVRRSRHLTSAIVRLRNGPAEPGLRHRIRHGSWGCSNRRRRGGQPPRRAALLLPPSSMGT